MERDDAGAQPAVSEAVLGWIRAATRRKIREGDMVAYAQVFVDVGFDSVELLASGAGNSEEFDEKIGDRIQSVIHRRLLKNALRSLAEAMSPVAVLHSEDGVEVHTKDVHVAGPGGHICAITVDARSTLQDLKARIEASSGIPAARQQLFHDVEELEAIGVLLEGEGVVELLLVRRAWTFVAGLRDLPEGTKVQVIFVDADAFRKAFSESNYVKAYPWANAVKKARYAGREGSVTKVDGKHQVLKVLFADDSVQWMPWEVLLVRA